MNKHRVIEIICVVFLVCFIAVISREDSYSDKTPKEIFNAVKVEMSMDDLSKVDKNKIKKDFGIDFQGIDSFLYYASDSIMNVNEIMIIKLKEGYKADGTLEKIEKRVNDKQVLFDGYAPQQSALLKNYVLTYKNGIIFYAVGDGASEALKEFKSTIR